MAYRSIDIDFWQDDYVISLDYLTRYVFLYVLQGSKTTQLGAYYLPIQIALLETGLDNETFDRNIKKLSEDKKIFYDDETKELMIMNWHKYNLKNPSQSQLGLLSKEILKVKSKIIKVKLLQTYKNNFSEKKFNSLISLIIEKDETFLEELKNSFKNEIDRLLIGYEHPIDTLTIGDKNNVADLNHTLSTGGKKIIAESQSESETKSKTESETETQSQSMSEVHQDELSPKNDYEEFSKQFNVLVEEWNKSEMAMERPITKTTTQMQSNAFKLLQKYSLGTILEVMEHVPSNRWYLGEIPNADGEVFNISSTWFLDINNFEDIMKKLPGYVPY
ncbi:hypothetical protein [Miniphocaeibacter sp.]|uniref:hypothetical protein n=1 Tax=Miniphocaeibacter sp. TaxID=3100973 RepID=UPI003BAE4D23